MLKRFFQKPPTDPHHHLSQAQDTTPITSIVFSSPTDFLNQVLVVFDEQETRVLKQAFPIFVEEQKNKEEEPNFIFHYTKDNSFLIVKEDLIVKRLQKKLKDLTEEQIVFHYLTRHLLLNNGYLLTSRDQPEALTTRLNINVYNPRYTVIKASDIFKEFAPKTWDWLQTDGKRYAFERLKEGLEQEQAIQDKG